MKFRISSVPQKKPVYITRDHAMGRTFERCTVEELIRTAARRVAKGIIR